MYVFILPTNTTVSLKVNTLHAAFIQVLVNMDNTHRFTVLLWLAAALTLTLARSSFRSRLPNGMLVPHPCGPAYVWRGVGHESHLGGGARNPFGLDFKDAGLKWTKELCEKDSDGDGLSNGQELGDPDCTWSPGTQPKNTEELSHPGVCEPLDAEKCKGKNDFVSCDDLCDGVKEDGVIRQTVTLDPPVTVPSNKMLHKCMSFLLPQDSKPYHMIGVQPQISDFRSVYHVLVLGCSGNKSPEVPGVVYDCYMNSHCNTELFQWTAGDADICFPGEAGLKMGFFSGAYRMAILEVHLFNPGDTERSDASGVNLFLTPNLRPNELGMFFFGQAYMSVPPGEEDFVVKGGCSGACMADKMTGAINITAAFGHMHFTGRQAILQRKSGDRLDYIAYDDSYDYNKPNYYRFDPPMEVQPGDGLYVDCHYNTSGRTRTQRYGFDTEQDEMCYGVIMYYPKKNMDLTYCSKYQDIDYCKRDDDIINGCDTTKLNFKDSDNVPAFEAVTKNCRAGTCLKECVDVVKTAWKNPCYSGSLVDRLVDDMTDRMDQNEASMFMGFLLKLTSCDKEIAAMDTMDNDTSGAAAGLTGGLHVVVLLASVALIATVKLIA